jgi:hypothetical protein
MKRAISRIAWVMLAATAMPAFGAKSLSLEQFDQLLIAERGKSDSKVTRQIAKVELTERATAAQLARWETEFPGARNALIALADSSQFLPLSPVGMLRDPSPSLDTQKRMLSMAIDYVGKVMLKLPDFFATRETLHFESTQISIEGPPLHFAGRSSLVVTYRDGRETQVAPSGSSPKQTVTGLTSTGEFGPILTIVLNDAVHGNLAWGYWEQATTPIAVFRYSVPQNESHYTVTFPNRLQTVTLEPGYHGEIALDPATGEILRLTLISDLPPRYRQVRAAMMVEYAPVTIGSGTYICPIQGVALSTFEVAGSTNLSLSSLPVSGPGVMQTQLNDVSFTHYHLFRAETKILPERLP